MARRIFISCAYEDRNRAKGFNLLRWNKNVDVAFVGRHLLDPVDSQDQEYTSRKIREQLDGTSVTVVLLSKDTPASWWVEREVAWSLEKGNGIVGIRLDDDAPTPDALRDCGAEVLDWDPALFEDAIERAALQTARTDALRKTGPDTGAGCAR